MQFKAVEKKNLVEVVQNQILDHMKTNKLSVGDKLPTEMELTESLGVSRSVLREALSRLRFMGLIQSKNKSGIMIAEPDVMGICETFLDQSFLQEQTQKELFELRLTLELGMVELLFARKTEEGVEALEAIIQREKKAKSEKERIKCDLEFHATLYKITGSNLLIKFQSILQPFFQKAAKKEREIEKDPVTHEDLLNALKNNAENTFRELLKKHLHTYIKNL